MNGINLVAKRLWLFLTLISFTSSVGFSAEMLDDEVISAPVRHRAEFQYSAPVAYGNFIYFYSEQAHKMRIVSADDTAVVLDTPARPGLLKFGQEERHKKSLAEDVPMMQDLSALGPHCVKSHANYVVALLEDGILLLLDTAQRRAVRIYGGIHNSSPRLNPTRRESHGEFHFAVTSHEETRELTAVVTHGKRVWRGVKVSGSSRMQASLTFNNAVFSLFQGKLLIRDLVTNALSTYAIGKGMQLPVLISGQRDLLAVVLRNEKWSGEVALFDPTTRKTIKRLSVGPLALPPALLGDKLFVHCFGDHLTYVFDLSDVFASESASR